MRILGGDYAHDYSKRFLLIDIPGLDLPFHALSYCWAFTLIVDTNCSSHHLFQMNIVKQFKNYSRTWHTVAVLR